MSVRFVRLMFGFADGALRQIMHWCKERGVFLEGMPGAALVLIKCAGKLGKGVRE